MSIWAAQPDTAWARSGLTALHAVPRRHYVPELQPRHGPMADPLCRAGTVSARHPCWPISLPRPLMRGGSEELRWELCRRLGEGGGEGGSRAASSCACAASHGEEGSRRRPRRGRIVCRRPGRGRVAPPAMEEAERGSGGEGAARRPERRRAGVVGRRWLRKSSARSHRRPSACGRCGESRSQGRRRRSRGWDGGES